jgi:hypothetical protein
MTAAALPFPNSPILAGWWRQLSARRPSTLWIGSVRVHRIEVLAKVLRTRPLDSLVRFVLAAIDAEKRSDSHDDNLSATPRQGPSVQLAGLESSLGLDSALLSPLLGRLERDGLIAAVHRNDAAPAWAMTPAGVNALEQGKLVQTALQRRTFSFLESSTSPRRLLFVQLAGEGCIVPISSPSSSCEAPLFYRDALGACLQESLAWKQLCGFPEEVLDVVSPEESSPLSAPEFWQRVPVDRIGQLFVVLSREPGSLHAFAVRLQDWDLHAAEPCFSLDDGDWSNLYPELTKDPPLEAWQKAWMEWGLSRGVPLAELEARPQERSGICLRAYLSKRAIDRLRSTRGDAWKSESWLVAGAGQLRPCARLEIVAT